MDYCEISRIISHFANSFDTKDWVALKNILADQVECCYQDLRGTKQIISNEEYVRLREEALQELQTQHLFCNLEIQIDRQQAQCRLNGIIFRRNHSGMHFNSHVMYEFGLTKLNNHWLICYIKQSVLWNEGDASIHKGAAAKKPE